MDIISAQSPIAIDWLRMRTRTHERRDRRKKARSFRATASGLFGSAPADSRRLLSAGGTSETPACPRILRSGWSLVWESLLVASVYTTAPRYRQFCRRPGLNRPCYPMGISAPSPPQLSTSIEELCDQVIEKVRQMAAADDEVGFDQTSGRTYAEILTAAVLSSSTSIADAPQAIAVASKAA